MRRLLNRQATVVTRETAGVDEFGNTTTVEVLRGPYPCRLEQQASTEQTVDRATVVTTYRAWLLPSAAVTARDELDVDGIRYRVSGDPVRREDGRGTHHIELTVVEVRA